MGKDVLLDFVSRKYWIVVYFIVVFEVKCCGVLDDVLRLNINGKCVFCEVNYVNLFFLVFLGFLEDYLL